MATLETLNVLMLSAEYPPVNKGGQGVHAAELVQGLSDIGCHVTVVTFTPHTTAVHHEQNIDVHFVMPKVSQPGQIATYEFMPSIAAFNQELTVYVEQLFQRQKTKPDVIHCQDWILFPAGQFLAQKWHIPIIGTVHLLDEPFQRWWGQEPQPENVQLERTYCQQVDALIAVSQALATVVADVHQVSKQKIHVVYNGVDAELFKSSLSAAAQAKLRRTIANPEEKIVMFAGRLSPVKGLPEFFAAAAHVVALFPQVQYVVVGEAASRTSAQLFKTLQQQYPELQKNLKWLGKVPRKQLALLYQVADMAVVPSIFESFGYAAAEAMAAGVPVVATQTGGMAEIISHEQTGLLVPLQVNEKGQRMADVEALVAAQCRLLQDTALAKQLGEAGKQRITQDFKLEQMAQATFEVYGQCREQYHQAPPPQPENGRFPASTLPWEQPKWLQKCESWIQQQVKKNGRSAIGPAQFVRQSPDSCVVRMPSTAGPVYLKAVPATYAHEPLLTQTLAQQFPGQLPTILSVEPQNRWLLMAEMPGQPLYLTFDIGQWQMALQTFAHMQLHYATYTADLLALGCFDRQLDKLMGRFRPFLSGMPGWFREQIGRVLEPGMLHHLNDLTPQLETAVRQIAAYNLPPTLDHGDFHPNNIHITAETSIFFDWADGAVSHPFFSPAALLGYVTYTLPDMKTQLPKLRQAYLHPWTVYQPLSVLTELFVQIQPLATLHYALNMYDCLLARPQRNWAADQELIETIAICLKLCIGSLRNPTYS